MIFSERPSPRFTSTERIGLLPYRVALLGEISLPFWASWDNSEAMLEDFSRASLSRFFNVIISAAECSLYSLVGNWAFLLLE